MLRIVDQIVAINILRAFPDHLHRQKRIQIALDQKKPSAKELIRKYAFRDTGRNRSLRAIEAAEIPAFLIPQILDKALLCLFEHVLRSPVPRMDIAAECGIHFYYRIERIQPRCIDIRAETGHFPEVIALVAKFGFHKPVYDLLLVDAVQSILHGALHILQEFFVVEPEIIPVNSCQIARLLNIV